jgi:hypothetical protein
MGSDGRRMILSRALQVTMTGDKEYNTKGGGHKDNLSLRKLWFGNVLF